MTKYPNFNGDDYTIIILFSYSSVFNATFLHIAYEIFHSFVTIILTRKYSSLSNICNTFLLGTSSRIYFKPHKLGSPCVHGSLKSARILFPHVTRGRHDG